MESMRIDDIARRLLEKVPPAPRAAARGAPAAGGSWPHGPPVAGDQEREGLDITGHGERADALQHRCRGGVAAPLICML